MNKIKNRVESVADYIINTNDTIRQIALYYGVSKSTIHLDLTTRLKKYNIIKYKCVQKILIEHDNNKHIKGGMSTKKKYESNVKAM